LLQELGGIDAPVCLISLFADYKHGAVKFPNAVIIKLTSMLDGILFRYGKSIYFVITF